VNRPILIPGLPRVWRGPDELQLGADPARALLLRLPDPRAAELLDLLDGARSERLVLLRAAQLGIRPEDSRALLDTLTAAGLAMPLAALVPHGLDLDRRLRLLNEASASALQDPRKPASTRPASTLRASPLPASTLPASTLPASTLPASTLPASLRPTPASVLRRRLSAQVLVTGHGRLGAPIAVALAEAGVGHVRPEVTGSVTHGELAGGPLRGTDVGRPRRDAIIDALSRNAPGTTHGVRRTAATLIIQLNHHEPVALRATTLDARRQPHLAVTIREGAAVIGPFVPAAGAPCLNCLDLHRRDRDASWPGSPAGPGPDAEPCAVTTVLAATAFAAAEALTFLDGGTPQTAGATTEISAPGRMRRRTWSPHPGCRHR
jgi:hypothetical protein